MNYNKLRTFIPVISLIISIGSIIISVRSCCFSERTESRTEKLFQAQRMPKIQVNPIKFETYYYNDESLMGRLTLKIINYAGFYAYDVNVDANWENNWIAEWIPVAAQGLGKMKESGTITPDQDNQLKSYKANVESKHSFDMEPNKAVKTVFQGSFTYDKNKKKIIMVRVKGRSENNAYFDKLFNYELKLTQAYGEKSFMLIPILSKDDE